MISFNYTIHNEMGLHARPVGLVVKTIKPYKEATITISHGDKSADARRMFAIMALQVKQGETITVSVEGGAEQEIADAILDIFKSENL